MKQILFISLSIILFSCTKNAEDLALPPTVLVAERLAITPTTISVLASQTTQLTAKYYNNTGNEAALPPSTNWSSSNTAVATVNNSGLVNSIAAGQSIITASYNNIIATATVNVLANNNLLATVNITPAIIQEVSLNSQTNFSAVGKNLAGNTIPGLTFLWSSSNSNIASISNTGVLTALQYGTVDITAAANSITSAATSVQIVRRANFFSGGSTGSIRLKIENGDLKIATSSDFSVQNGHPDLRLYLTNNPSTNAGAVQIAPLTTAGRNSGAYTWLVPSGINITQYRYALVWCAAFGGVYGLADFGI